MASPPVKLPDKIVYDNILARLPFRALRRFTAVCKAWRHTICHDDAFAAAQARTPSSSSVAIARFVEGSLELQILPPWAADVVPLDPYLSFVEVDHGRLSFCACTGGVVCLKERTDPAGNPNPKQHVCNFYVVNPNRKSVRRVPYDYDGEVVTAGLAYDPEGFQLVVPVAEDGGRCRFRRFSSRRAEWSASREAFALPPPEEFKPKPVYASGHLYWLAGHDVVWYDLVGDRAGTMELLAAGKERVNDDRLDIGAWRGRLRVALVNTVGLSVHELAAGGLGAGPERWEVLHSRRWENVPGLICPESDWTHARWKLGAVEMEAGGEEAVCLEVTTERDNDSRSIIP